MASRAGTRTDGAGPPAAERVKSADRVMAVLDLVAERGSMPFREIADRLELPKSSAHALLRTMEARSYLAFDPEARTYRVGTRIWELAQALFLRRRLPQQPARRRRLQSAGRQAEAGSTGVDRRGIGALLVQGRCLRPRRDL